MNAVNKQATDQYLLLQGRQFALELVDSYGDRLYSAKGVGEAISRLAVASTNKPDSYVLGINNVVDALKKGLEEMAPSTLVSTHD